MIRRGIHLFIVFSLALFVVAGPFAIETAQAAKEPKYRITFAAPLKYNRTKNNQIRRAVKRFVQTFPEIGSIHLNEVIVVHNDLVGSYCHSKETYACYAPYEGKMWLTANTSEDATIYHELFHASVVDSSGSAIGSYYDLVEEGMAEFMSLRMSSYARPAYLDEVEVMNGVVDLLGRIAGASSAATMRERGVEELRKIMFVEGKQTGLNQRLGKYSTYDDPYTTLNYLLKEDRYDDAKAWIAALTQKVILEQAKVTPPTEEETVGEPSELPAQYSLIANGKIVRPSATSSKADAILFWKVQSPDPSVPYIIWITNHGEDVAVLSEDDSKKGTYTFPVTLPYTASVDIHVLAPVNEKFHEVVAQQQLVFNAALTNEEQSSTPPGSGTTNTDSPGTGSTGNGTGTGATGSTSGPKTVAAVEAVNFAQTGNSVVIRTTQVNDKEQKEVVFNWNLTTNPGKLTLKIFFEEGSLVLPLPENKRSGSEIQKVVQNGVAISSSNFDKIAPGNVVRYYLMRDGKKVSGLDLTATASEGTISAGTAPDKTSDNKECYAFKDTLFGESICAPQYFRRFYFWAVGLAIAGAIATIVYAGYKITVSKNNPSEVKNGKEIIVSTLVGLVLLLLSYTILQFLGVPLK